MGIEEHGLVTYEPLVDSFGRVVGDLRISVIDRCDLRCTYCMPAEGLPWLKRDLLLSPEEIERVATIFVGCGVREVKLTGGEPLVRRELPEIVGRLRGLDELADSPLDLSITTNGRNLDRVAGALHEAGLDRVTVSCDSLLPHRFAEMTRRDVLDEVLAGLEEAVSVGFDPIKVNCVVIRGTNDDEVCDFAELARRTGAEVRFIEYMPLDAEERWTLSSVVPAAEVLERISASYELLAANDDGGPATVYRFADGSPGTVGVIPTVTEPFCASCNRVRLTAEGQLRACLFALEETDLRTPMRDGADDAELEALIRTTVENKWAGHHIGKADFVRPARSMSQIGG